MSEAVYFCRMEILEMDEMRRQWGELLRVLERQFGEKPNLNALLFLIGVQELGQGHKKFTKDEKQDLMHIATCKLLSFWGYYSLDGKDEEGWPQWKAEQELPRLTLGEQERLLRQSAILYFRENNLEF